MRSTAPILVAVSLAALCLAPPSASAQSCIKCHVKRWAEKSTDKVFFEKEWKAGVHAKLECTTCHKGEGPKAFFQLPHRLSGSPPSCLECHGDDFAHIATEFQRSVHAQRIGASFSCVACHDPHTHRAKPASLPRGERVRLANRRCTECHTSEPKLAKALDDAHARIPRMDAHAKMRCVVCHVSGSVDVGVHEVLPRAQAIQSCESCHDVNAPLIAKYVGRDQRASWVTNPVLFKEAYVPGATRNRVVDGLIQALFWLTVLGAFAHGVLRVVTRRNRPRMSDTAEKVRLYPVWLRVWHWSNAILFLVLAYTGIRMHFGPRRGPILSFETAFNVHNLLGCLLTVVGVLFFVGNYLSGNQRQYLSKPRDGFQGVLKQARWYLIGIFKGEPHPYHASPEQKFNPLQQLAYVGLMYVAYPLILLSGVVLLFPSLLPERLLGYPGAWWAAALHWALSAAAIVFLVGHLYLGSMGDKVRDLYAAMLDGDHRHRTPES